VANSVSLCMIVRDEAANVRQLLGDVAPVVEEIHVVDTGSTDDTVALVRQMADLHPGKIRLHYLEWQDDFAAARAYSFSFATRDWIFWLDGDDRVDTESLAFFKDHVLDSDADVDSWSLRYVYSIDVDGTPLEVFERERFVRRSTRPRWRPRIHEKIDTDMARCRFYPDLEVIHGQGLKPDAGERNYRILQEELSRHPDDPEVLYFWARELWHRGDVKSVRLFERFIALPGVRPPLEILARFCLGEHYHAGGRHDAALDMAHAIYKLDHTRRRSESYYLWGITEQALSRYRVAIAWLERCLDDNHDWPRRCAIEHYSHRDLRTWLPWRRIAECHARRGQTEEARRALDAAQRHVIDDDESRAWRAQVEEMLTAKAPPGGTSRATNAALLR